MRETCKQIGIVCLIVMVAVCLLSSACMAEPGGVSLWRLPDGAIQPQAAVDSKGVVHLIYFKSGAADGAGNLYYVRLAAGQERPTAPIRVNSREDTAGCVGTVRTAQLAIGKGDRVHVVWNGLGPKSANGYPVTYQAYSHLNDAGTAFEPQRDLITWAKGLDGGGSVAADKDGNVYVAWHAMANAKDESGRAVFVSHSTDNGATFTRETQANPEPTGACACCGMRAFTDSRGVLYILYRAATNRVDRDTVLLVSRDRGRSFVMKRLQPWRIDACPMSTYTLAENGNRILAAWETSGGITYSSIDPGTLDVSPPSRAAGAGTKHPFTISSSDGHTLLVWTVGTGWQRGGSLAWQVMDRDGAVISRGAKADGIPVWGLATAYALPDGGFKIVY